MFTQLAAAFALERFAVGALIYSRIRFMRSYGNAVERTIFSAVAMVGAFFYGAADSAVIVFLIHEKNLLK